jgi:MoaA/NifB/PqqE/SkfB family radical SAM enzyme
MKQESSRRQTRIGALIDWAIGIRRRSGWVVDNLTVRKASNLFLCGVQFVLRRPVPFAMPAVLKVDINANCNLHCTVCVHAMPHGRPELERQQVSPRERMSLTDFEALVQQVAGRSSAVSLYYLGDPLLHPEIDEICAAAWRHGLNTHVSSNFSFRWSDERLERLVRSGLTHLTVCLDGMTQETYGRTRVGGRLELVLSNLERLIAIRNRLGRRYPQVEVQFIRFQHNVEELPLARQRCAELGVDQFSDFWGSLHNYTDVNPGRYVVHGPKRGGMLPHCLWPFFAMQIKYDGDVIPCCMHRQGEQYDPTADPRTLGNVFRSSIASVWGSTAYRDVRRVVVNPDRAEREGIAERNFCHGCGVVYDNTALELTKPADRHRWEDSYERTGRTVRPRGRPLPLAPDADLAGAAPPEARTRAAGRVT